MVFFAWGGTLRENYENMDTNFYGFRCTFFCEMLFRSVVRIKLRIRLACKPRFAQQTPSLKYEHMLGVSIQT